MSLHKSEESATISRLLMAPHSLQTVYRAPPLSQFCTRASVYKHLHPLLVFKSSFLLFLCLSYVIVGYMLLFTF